MRVYRVAIRPMVTYGAEQLILIKGEEDKSKKIREEICEKNLRPKKSSGRSLPKTGEFGGPGKIARWGHYENYKDPQAAMVAHKKDGRRKSSEESVRVETRL